MIAHNVMLEPMVPLKVSQKCKLFRNKSNYSVSSAKEQSNQEVKREYKWVYAFQYKSDNTVNMEIFHFYFKFQFF